MSTDKKEVFTARFARDAEGAEKRVVFSISGDAEIEKALSLRDMNCKHVIGTSPV